MPIGENVSIRWIANVTSSLLKNFNYRRRLDSPQTHHHYFQTNEINHPGLMRVLTLIFLINSLFNPVRRAGSFPHGRKSVRMS